MIQAHKGYHLVLSCEHASNHVPSHWLTAFNGQQQILKSHRAYDFGAIEVAMAWQRLCKAPLYKGAVSRLLIDLNRSQHHAALWSKYAKRLQIEDQKIILTKYYLPYREEVQAFIQAKINQGFQVIHISIHSFSPFVSGKRRKAHIGLLYDPARPLEKSLALKWQQSLRELLPKLQIRRNYPYRGTADGFTVALRRSFLGQDYIGIELEMRQDWLKKKSWSAFAHIFHQSLQAGLQP